MITTDPLETFLATPLLVTRYSVLQIKAGCEFLHHIQVFKLLHSNQYLKMFFVDSI